MASVHDEIKKYTANYAYTNPNFGIQNLVTNQTNTDLLPILFVIKNILQRGSRLLYQNTCNLN